jgi:3-methyladenine DNA glycosylase AlkD
MAQQALKDLIEEVKSLKNPEKIKVYKRFFKTGKGEYAEGDVFLGLITAQSREVVKKYRELIDLADVQKLLDSKTHEHRSIALGILKHKFAKATAPEQESIVKLYLKNTHNINNWDLVDCSAPHILGAYLIERDRTILYKLANSDLLWERRIAMLATFAFIRNNDFEDTLKIAEILVEDTHDLIHKAVGWLLREVGKRDLKTEEKFLKRHYKTMPRIMLRYAIERFDPDLRDFYMGRTTKYPKVGTLK